ncbi:hypothetical protein HYY74_00680 [Candidatus Woesearchaeota archaeon]|nr:hypothetical protein [Candidatus Woesearchaeota archaeon]
MIRITPDLVFKSVAALLALFLIYNIAVKLAGGSLTIDQFLLSFFIAFLTLLFKIAVGQAKIEAKLENLENSFKAMASDFKQHSHRSGRITF